MSAPAKALFELQRRPAKDEDGIVTVFRDGIVTLRSRRRTDGFTNAFQEIGYQGVRAGDLVIHSMDGFAGAIGISDSDGKASPVVHAYVARQPIDARYYAYLLRTLARHGFIASLARGIRERSTAFDAPTFRSLKLPRPPRENQRAIACLLDDETARLDALVEKKRQLMQLLAARLASHATQAILGDLDPISGQGQLRHGWTRPRLGVALDLQRGFDLPHGDRIEGSVPVVSSGGVSGWHDTPACQSPGVITGRYGTVGDVHYVEVPYWPLNTTLFVSDFRGNDPRWVYHLLRVLPLNIDEEKSAVTGINRNVIGQLFVPLPPVSVQRAIAAQLDTAETHYRKVIDRLRRQIELLRDRRDAVITAAVTGQFDLTKAAA